MSADRVLGLTTATMLEQCDALLSSCETAVPRLADMPGRRRRAGLEAIAFGAEEALAAARDPGREPDPSFWSAYFTDSARRDIPLRMQQAVIDYCVTGLVRSAWNRCDDRDLRAVLAFTAAADQQQHEVHRLAVETYHAYYALSGQTDRAGRMRAENLLDGHGTGEDPVLVVVVPAEAGRAVPRHRSVLRTDRRDRTVLLLPGGPGRTKAEGVIRSLLEHAGGPVAGACWADDDAAVPSAYRQAKELADIAAVIPGVRSPVTPEDVVLERRLREDPDLTHQLVRPLEPISGLSALLETVETLLQFDLDRTATAAALHVNRRTLTSRLQRVAALTGFDPRTARGLQVLANALAAREIGRLPDGS